MNSDRRGRLLAASCLALAPVPALAQNAPDSRDRRIEALEAQVRALSAAVAELKAQRGVGPASVAGAAPLPGGAQVASAASASQPLPSSPDQSQPVTSSGPGPNTGGVTILAGKPSIVSGDGRFAANFHAVMQFDAAGYFQRAAGIASGAGATDFRRGGAAGDTAHARDLNNGTNFRRARIGIDGKIFGDFDYNVLFEFGGAGAEDAGHIQEMWLQYTGLQPFKLRVGAFPPSVGLEDQNSTNGMPFLERPAISDISRSVAGGDFREAAMLTASGARWFAAATLSTRTVGTVNTTGSSTAQSFDQNLGGILRVAVLPIMGDDYLVHVGAHGSRVFSVADAGGPDIALTGRYPVQLQERPELRVDGTRLISTGAINAKHVNEGGLELAGQKRQFYIQGEYERIGIERRASALSDPHFNGWYVEGSWILTGERRRYNTNTFSFDAPPVDHPFDLKHGTFGAVELAGRYSRVDLNYHDGTRGLATPADGVRGGEQKIAAASLNWYLNPAIRFMFEYQHVEIDRLSPSAATFLTPVGAEIGQKYSTIALRSQLAF